jgi:hypothetical protein
MDAVHRLNGSGWSGTLDSGGGGGGSDTIIIIIIIFLLASLLKI